MFEYTFEQPQKIIFKENSIEDFFSHTPQKSLLIADSFFRESSIIKSFPDFQNDVLFITPGEPDVDSITRISKSIGRPVEHIYAMGGGSCIDTAKIIRLMLEQRCSLDKITITESTEHAVTLTAVPTTPATGSEVTKFAVYSKNMLKTTLIGSCLIPDTAYIDSSFTDQIPHHILTISVADALSHCTEAILSKTANDISDTLASKGISIISKYLLFPGEESKKQLIKASCIGGLCINYASVCEGHLMGHLIASLLHLPHGKSVGILLPAVIEYNRRYKNEKIKIISKIFGTTEDKCPDMVFDMLKNAGLYDNLNTQPYKNISDKITEPLWYEGSSFICSQPFEDAQKHELYSIFLNYLELIRV